MTTRLPKYLRWLRFATTLTLATACGALALFWPGWMTALKAQTYYPISLSIVSGSGGSAPSGQLLPSPLVVQTSPPTSGLVIQWSVSSGGGTLGSPTSTTDSSGRASNTLRVGTTPSITVQASRVGSNTVTFTATCTNCDVHTPVVPGTEQALAGLQQAGSMVPTAVLTARTQINNIGLRLLNLRRGGPATSAAGLALNVDGEPAPVGLAAGNMFSLFNKGTGASADSSPLGNLGVFATGLGTFGDQRSSSREPGFDFHTAGMTAGADYRVLPNLVLGGALGYGSMRSDFDGGAGEVTSQGLALSAYAGFTLGGFHADGILSYGWMHYDTERNLVDATGPVTAKASPGGDQFAVAGNVGYDWSFGALTVGPSFRVTYVDVQVERFTERGGGPFNLRVQRQTSESLTTALGGEVSYAISVPVGVLTPLVRFEWEHEYLGGSRLVSGTLVADSTQTLFGIRTNNPDRDYFNLGVGLTGTFRSGVSAFFYYESLLGRDRITNHSFTAGVRLEF